MDPLLPILAPRPPEGCDHEQSCRPCKRKFDDLEQKNQALQQEVDRLKTATVNTFAEMEDTFKRQRLESVERQRLEFLHVKDRVTQLENGLLLSKATRATTFVFCAIVLVGAVAATAPVTLTTGTIGGLGIAACGYGVVTTLKE